MYRKDEMDERRKRILELRAQGLSLEEIADRFGMTADNAGRVIRKYRRSVKNGKAKNILQVAQ